MCGESPETFKLLVKLLYLRTHIDCISDQYVLLGAEEGLFSLHVIPNNPDPVMEQVWTYMYAGLRITGAGPIITG